MPSRPDAVRTALPDEATPRVRGNLHPSPIHVSAGRGAFSPVDFQGFVYCTRYTRYPGNTRVTRFGTARHGYFLT